MIIKYSSFIDTGWTYVEADVIKTSFHKISKLAFNANIGEDATLDTLADVIKHPNSEALLKILEKYILNESGPSVKTIEYHIAQNESNPSGFKTACCVTLQNYGKDAIVHVFQTEGYKIYLLNDSGKTVEKII